MINLKDLSLKGILNILFVSGTILSNEALINYIIVSSDNYIIVSSDNYIITGVK